MSYFECMLKIGLTGGIGSGKTTVAHIFETLGIPVYYADDAAKKIMNEDVHLRQSIIKNFGTDSYVNGALNRPYLSSIVFGNAQQLALLNALVHPVTLADADSWAEKQQSPYVIKEAALMFESDAWKMVDKVIGVSAPYALRVERAMQRDQLSKEEVEARINSQMNEADKMSRCDFIIQNNETELLIPQVIKIHEMLLKETAAS
jgi:dephospho-CoA kinase